MKVRLTVKNTSRADYGRVYEYNSILDYLFDNRESFDEMLEEDGHSCLTDEEIREVANEVFDTDIEGRFESDFDLDNSWKEQDLIDFDNPIVNGVDVAQSMYSAITDTCYFVKQPC
jgi:hypothetical protein